MALIQGSIILHRLIKGNVKNLQVSDSGPLCPSCSVLCLLCLCECLFICVFWSTAGKGLTSWLSFVVSNCEFVTFPLVSWVRCGTWLYRFLIFAPLLILICYGKCSKISITLKLWTPKIIAENNFWNILKNQILPFLAHLSLWLMVSYCDCVMSVVRRQQLLQRTSFPKLLAGFWPNWK